MTNVDEPTDISLFSQCDDADTDAPETMPVSDEILPGARLGEYVVESTLGRGGCGVVYLGHHEATRGTVAIKVLHAHLTVTPKVVTRFLREIHMIELLHHPHIVAIESTGELADGRPYYVMEYLGENTLASILREQGTLSVADCVKILGPVCSALAAAHEAGIVHRDIKASNISVKHEGDAYVVKLLDFGVAKLGRTEADGTGFTTRGRIVGTLHTMAPEQLRGLEIDHRADIYALGTLLYRLLTGKVVFDSKLTMEVILRHLEEPAPRPSLLCNVPPSVDAVVLRCLEKDPARRFQSVQGFIEALRLAAKECAPEPAQDTRGEAVSAVGVYVELHASDGDGEMDEALEDDTQQALDIAEEALTNAGFSMVLATGNALLGVLPLSGEASSQAAEERRAKAIADALRRELFKRAGENGRFEVTVSLRVGEVFVERADELRFLGGPLLQTDDWVTSAETRGLSIPPPSV